MAWNRPLVFITAAISALVVIGVIWHDRSLSSVANEKSPAVAGSMGGAAKPAAAVQPPAKTDVAAPAPTEVVAVESKPVVTAAPPRKSDGAITARQEAKDRKVIVRRYSKLFDELNLNPAQREQLTRLLVDVRESSADYAGAVATTGVDASQDPDAFAQSVFELRAQLQDQIKELLGPDGYAKFLAGDELIKQSAVIERAQVALNGSGAVLTDQQANRLQGILQDLGVHYVTDEVLARAGPFLSEPQLDALKQQQAQRANGAGKRRVQAAIQRNKP